MIIFENTQFDLNKRYRKATGTVWEIGDRTTFAFGTKQNLGSPADLDYLAKNQDVANAINQGLYGLTSGYDHYMTTGATEGRTYNFSLNIPASSTTGSSLFSGNTAKYLFIGVLAIGAAILLFKHKKKS
jgi:hypothetical protein